MCMQITLTDGLNSLSRALLSPGHPGSNAFCCIVTIIFVPCPKSCTRGTVYGRLLSSVISFLLLSQVHKLLVLRAVTVSYSICASYARVGL
jgi:hypothetical protein